MNGRHHVYIRNLIKDKKTAPGNAVLFLWGEDDLTGRTLPKGGEKFVHGSLFG